jgi:hypothetical protein
MLRKNPTPWSNNWRFCGICTCCLQFARGEYAGLEEEDQRRRMTWQEYMSHLKQECESALAQDTARKPYYGVSFTRSKWEARKRGYKARTLRPHDSIAKEQHPLHCATCGRRHCFKLRLITLTTLPRGCSPFHGHAVGMLSKAVSRVVRYSCLALMNS